MTDMVFDVDSLYVELSSLPSEATMQIWRQFADTYNAANLASLWHYQFATLSAYHNAVGTPNHVVTAVMKAIAYGSVLIGIAPNPAWKALNYAYDRVPKDSNWLLFQEYVEDVSQAWAEIGY